ncbi:uncharacterized protein LOC127750767 [Frankliniella occidentalis]|uniref:Uncharacterized protein LOC127750767 n=1 Tax=Frankliniella occidentalis TaxID=133901 RepID=A0A9C6XSA3_FRAOC|nr:uncharacterized protein LOC127750767 [Frankliniella occidentalis]
MLDQVHADISAIILSFCPEMLEAYLHQRVPSVPSQPEFTKCIVHPYLWKESFDPAPQGDGAAEGEVSNDSGQLLPSEDEEEQCCLQPPKKKNRPNRKLIKCPACDKPYKGGQKQRLLDHVISHKDMTAEQNEQVQAALVVLFPERGNKLPKKQCVVCGKFVANMAAHKKSKACIPRQ